MYLYLYLTFNLWLQRQIANRSGISPFLLLHIPTVTKRCKCPLEVFRKNIAELVLFHFRRYTSFMGVLVVCVVVVILDIRVSVFNLDVRVSVVNLDVRVSVFNLDVRVLVLTLDVSLGLGLGRDRAVCIN